jgi:hypothetical protein
MQTLSYLEEKKYNGIDDIKECKNVVYDTGVEFL